MRSNLSLFLDVRFSSLIALSSGRINRLIASSTVASSLGLLIDDVVETPDRTEGIADLRSALEESRLDSVPLMVLISSSRGSLLRLLDDLRGELSSSLPVFSVRLVLLEDVSVCACCCCCCCCSFSMTRCVMRSLLRLLLLCSFGAFSSSGESATLESVSTVSRSRLLLLRRPGARISGVPSSMLSAGMEEMSDVMGMKRPPLLDRSLPLFSTSMSTGGSDETVEPSEYSCVWVWTSSSRVFCCSEMRRVYEGLVLFLAVWVRWTWSMPWRFLLRELGVTLTRTLGRERVLPFSLPASKYSMSRLVWLGYFLCRLALVVLMVTGVPSSGMLYEVLSVRAETLVSTSSRRVVSSWSAELRVEGSVGAGRGGRLSKPIVES